MVLKMGIKRICYITIVTLMLWMGTSVSAEMAGFGYGGGYCYPPGYSDCVYRSYPEQFKVYWGCGYAINAYIPKAVPPVRTPVQVSYGLSAPASVQAFLLKTGDRISAEYGYNG